MLIIVELKKNIIFFMLMKFGISFGGWNITYKYSIVLRRINVGINRGYDLSY